MTTHITCMIKNNNNQKHWCLNGDCSYFLLTGKHANRSSQCSQAAALCTQALVGLRGGFLISANNHQINVAEKLPNSNHDHKANWACALHDGRGRLRLSLYMYTMYALPCLAVCHSLDFTWVAVRFVIQIKLSSWKVVSLGQVDLGCKLNR